MIKWQEFINIIGKTEISAEFLNLLSSMQEKPEISENPTEWNDPERTKYYKFFNTGILIGCSEVIRYIRFYLEKVNNYSIYQGKILDGIGPEYNKQMLINLLGEPSIIDDDKPNYFLGYIKRWILYDMGSYSILFEFNHNGFICAVTLGLF